MVTLHVNDSPDLSPAVIITTLIWGVALVSGFLAFLLLPETANSNTVRATQIKRFSP